MTESDFANKHSPIPHDIHHSPPGDEHSDEGDPHPTQPTHEDHKGHHETEATREKEKVMKTTNLKKVAGLVLTACGALLLASPSVQASASQPGAPGIEPPNFMSQPGPPAVELPNSASQPGAPDVEPPNFAYQPGEPVVEPPTLRTSRVRLPSNRPSLGSDCLDPARALAS